MNLKGLIILSILVSMVTWWDVSSSATPLGSLLPKKDLPEGWTLIEGPRVYTRKTLFERINGQAELFFKYGFQKSVFGTYQNKKNPDKQIELDIYDMGNVVQAFGILSRFRNEDRPGGIGLDSYLDDQSAFFYKGKYFVMLYATQSDFSILKQWAMRISSKIKDPSFPPREIGYFPQNGLRAGSIQYFTEGLLGYNFLKRGFQAIYSHGEKEVRLFLAIFASSQEAQKALTIYREDLSKRGTIDPETFTSFGLHAFRGKDPYRGRVLIIRKGLFLSGVTGFEEETKAENLLTEFIKNIK